MCWWAPLLLSDLSILLETNVCRLLHTSASQARGPRFETRWEHSSFSLKSPDFVFVAPRVAFSGMRQARIENNLFIYYRVAVIASLPCNFMLYTSLVQLWTYYPAILFTGDCSNNIDCRRLPVWNQLITCMVSVSFFSTVSWLVCNTILDWMINCGSWGSHVRHRLL